MLLSAATGECPARRRFVLLESFPVAGTSQGRCLMTQACHRLADSLCAELARDRPHSLDSGARAGGHWWSFDCNRKSNSPVNPPNLLTGRLL